MMAQNIGKEMTNMEDLQEYALRLILLNMWLKRYASMERENPLNMCYISCGHLARNCLKHLTVLLETAIVQPAAMFTR
jgi:hypothetical protein